MAALCVKPHRLPAYNPHRKGKVERIHRTIESTWACGLPGYTKGPRDAAGKLLGPLSDTAADRAAAEGAPGGPMRIELLAQKFSAWVTWYNTERGHDGLDGRTPLQAWTEDPTALDRMKSQLPRLHRSYPGGVTHVSATRGRPLTGSQTRIVSFLSSSIGGGDGQRSAVWAPGHRVDRAAVDVHGQLELAGDRVRGPAARDHPDKPHPHPATSHTSPKYARPIDMESEPRPPQTGRDKTHHQSQDGWQSTRGGQARGPSAARIVLQVTY
jgi:putative transposase